MNLTLRALLGLLLLVGACRDTAQTGMPIGGSDASTALTTCQSSADCAPDRVCHSTRAFCVVCEENADCGSGEACSAAFECVPSAQNPDAGVAVGPCSGTCSDRTGCAPDRVCQEGACCPPPERCTEDTDCPLRHPTCDVGAGTCGGGDNCFQDAACDDKPGCALEACACVGAPGGACVLKPSCADDTECLATLPGQSDGYCDLAQAEPYCRPRPLCSVDFQCAARGLVCAPTAQGENRCSRGAVCSAQAPCPGDRRCVNGSCQALSCLTDPSLCAPGEVCRPETATCGMEDGDPCNDNQGCPGGQYCDLADGVCRVGCRDDGECAGGICNAANQCEGSGNGMVCEGCQSNADCPAGTDCQNLPVLGQRCFETCGGGGGCNLSGTSCIPGLEVCLCL